MKITTLSKWLLASLLTFSVAAPVLSADVPSVSKQLIAQADDAKAEPAETKEQSNKPQPNKVTLAETKEGKYALAAVVGAVILLFVLIFIKSSKLD